MSHVSPDELVHAASGSAESHVVDRQSDTSSLNNAQFETQQPEELQVHDFGHNDIPNMAELGTDALLSGDLNGIRGDFWLDQAMMDIDMQTYNYINTPPDAAVIPQGAFQSPATTQQEIFKITCGLTGDMDPYLMQRYKFGPDNKFVFKRLTVQSMSQDVHPVQLLAYNQTEGTDELNDDTTRELLEQLVSPDVGTRLVSLYDCVCSARSVPTWLTTVDTINMCTLMFLLSQSYRHQNLNNQTSLFWLPST